MEQAVASRTALSVACDVRLTRFTTRRWSSMIRSLSVFLGRPMRSRLRRTPLRPDRPFSTALRAFLVARSRYAEDNLRRAVSRGVEQYVLLGAGLDTFAYRNPFAKLRVFEVDHPATQQWKRELLQRNNIAIPDSIAYTPVDFERQSLAEQLGFAGFDSQAPAFFAWLGVVPYLTLEAFRATLGFISAQRPGSGVTLDYGQPRATLPLLEQMAHDSLASRVEKAGEPFQLFFTPPEIAAELSHFHSIEDLGAAEINARYFSGRSDQLKMRGTAARFLTAWL